MATIKEFEAFFENKIPKALSMEGDVDGMCICTDPDKEVQTVVVALDVSTPSLKFAANCGADLMITHHPCIFNKLQTVDARDAVGKRVVKAIEHGISVMAFHTRLDAIEGGVNDSLCDVLGFSGQVPFGGCGRFLTLPREYSYAELSAYVGEKLGTGTLSGVDAGKKIKTLAMLGGSGKSFIEEAAATGADAFLTGEVAHSSLIDARTYGMSVICATHYCTEAVVLPKLVSLVKEGFGDSVRVMEFYEEY